MFDLTSYERSESRKVVVAVIDRSAGAAAQIAGALTSFYRALPFEDADFALSQLIRMPPCVIFVDESAAGGARRIIERIRGAEALRSVPVIYTTGNNRVTLGRDVREMGADAFLVKPYRRSALLKAISALVNRSIEGKWEALPEPQKATLKNTVELYNSISDLIDRGEPISYADMSGACSPLVGVVRDREYKSMLACVRDHDNYSYVHSLRVATFLSLFGHAIGMGEEELRVLASGGLMHDLGKMQIGHEVLNKPGRLTPEEMTVMRTHVERSVHYLSQCPSIPKGVVLIAAQHHEKLDGSGYPNGLKDKELNTLSRMAAIVDIFTALTDRRVYKPPMGPEQALAIMTRDMAGQLDQGLLGQFRAMLLDAVSS